MDEDQHIPKRKLTIDERFAIFDRENPDVWHEFKKYALTLLERGWRHYSADGIGHVIRFHRAVRLDRPVGSFKLNDHFPSRYSRKLAKEDPRFASFFEFRRLREREQNGQGDE